MSEKVSVARLALEFVVIVVGVLVALAVDQWVEGRSNDDLARATMRVLAAELRTNQEQLARRIEYHEAVLPTLDSLRREAAAGRRVDILGGGSLPRGFGFWLLRDTAWETALVTEAVRLFDLEITTLLSYTYSLQEALGENEDMVARGVVRPEWLGAADQGGAAAFLSVLLSSMLEDERELAGLIRRSLAALGERLGEEGAAPRVEVTERFGHPPPVPAGA